MNFVAYYRVSTQKQGQSGLGLEAQQSSVEAFRASNDATVVSEYTEIETGKKSTRPQILQAIALCKQTGATLVVAKLDRLARNVAFTATLMDSGCEFVCCDNPHATRMTIHILSAVAENEAQMISKRTKEALAASRARGTLPYHPPTPSTLKAQAASVKAAAEYAAKVRPLAARKRQAGKTLQEIAHYLTGSGVLTRRGKAWTPMAVKLLLERTA
jgi:DNA invertase Pin-like site-specific DNA recombinase